jgi:bifunctional pyridoxal-dependent enzyme with beta-cystathionase and maltose regulon repressor activities
MQAANTLTGNTFPFAHIIVTSLVERRTMAVALRTFNLAGLAAAAPVSQAQRLRNETCVK